MATEKSDMGLNLFWPVYFITKCIIKGLTSDRHQSKKLVTSTNVDQRLLEIELLIANCHLTGDKWQSKTLFLAKFFICVWSGFDCCLSGVGLQCKVIILARWLKNMPIKYMDMQANLHLCC